MALIPIHDADLSREDIAQAITSSSKCNRFGNPGFSLVLLTL